MLNPKLPKISVVTVSYNQAEFIRDCIDSVIAQNYPNFEHLIIDGGSTDGTLDILKEYPHLNWVSEPDRGQSHALNKGFAKATGEIIAWLNCDDWYAPGTFELVAKELVDYPVLLTAAHEVNKDKSLRQVVPNYCKTKFDLLKNWVPYAWVVQVAVFFRKDLLESVRLGPGTFLDESLNFCMDLDLWLRMSNLYPFTKRIDRVCAYYRIYESNKTGARPIATNRECMRTFRRYENVWNRTERRLAFVIASNTVDQDLAKTITSVVEQDLPDYDLVLADCSNDPRVGKDIREYSLDLAEAINHINFRYINCHTDLVLTAYNRAVLASSTNYVCLCQAGDEFESSLCKKTLQRFGQDLIGAIFPKLAGSNLPGGVISSQSGTIDPIALLQAPHFPPNLLIRKLAFQDLGGFAFCHLPVLSLKLFLLKMLVKNWWVDLAGDIEFKLASKNYSAEAESLDALASQVNAQIIVELDRESRENEFAKFKADSGLIPLFSSPVVAAAVQTLAKSPINWHELPQISDSDELKKLAFTYPECAGAWFYLAKQLNAVGNREAEEDARLKFRMLQSRVF